MTKAYLVVFERAAEDNWGAWVPDISGAVGAGDSLSAARESVVEGVKAQLEYSAERGEPLPEPVSRSVDFSEFDPDPDSSHYEIEWLRVDLAPYTSHPHFEQQAA